MITKIFRHENILGYILWGKENKNSSSKRKKDSVKVPIVKDKLVHLFF